MPLDKVFQFCLCFTYSVYENDQFGDISVVDKVVQVCSALNNLCPSVFFYIVFLQLLLYVYNVN